MTLTLCRRLAARASLLALTLAGATFVQAQSLDLFDRPEFDGRRLSLQQPVPDLRRVGMDERTSSLIVHQGNWELCTQPDYRGNCIRVAPGRYGRLPAGLDNRVSSLRPLDGQPPPGPGMGNPGLPPRPQPGSGPQVMLYSAALGGQSLLVDDAVENLARRGFNDAASDIDVLSGTWELCADGGYGGACQRFGPGRHSLPPALRDRLSSLRPVSAASLLPGRPGFDNRPGDNRPGADRADIVLYEDSRGGGRQLALDEAVRNLGDYGFNDRASSIEVRRGQWLLCRDANFEGDCARFGPGRHELQRPLADGVSSLRPLRADDRPGGGGGIGGGGGRNWAVTLYDDLDGRSRGLRVDEAVPDLREQRFNDRTAAIEVHAGRWQLCPQSDYRGRCVEFGPGRHRLPPGLAGELSSLRPLR